MRSALARRLVRVCGGGAWKKRGYHEISYSAPGDPSRVLTHHYFLDDGDNISPPACSSIGMVRVEMLCAPLNPADINSIQGRYPLPDRTKDPLLESIGKSRYVEGNTVAGAEGLGIVTDTSGGEGHVNVGQVVTMGRGGLGTFRSSFWAPASFLVPLTRADELYNKLGGQAATLPQLGGTAIRLLRDFCKPKPGEVVIQNAGNSGVGFILSQLAHVLHGMSVVSIVRRAHKTSEQWNELVQYLTTVGKCAMVVAEEDLLSSKDVLKELQSDLRSMSMSKQLPRLGLNAVGGDCASLIQKCLDHGGTMVTYGGMSMRPVTTSTSQLIFRDLRVLGYWHSRWMIQNPLEARMEMLDELVVAALDNGVACPQIQEFLPSSVHDALLFNDSQSTNPIRRKVVFKFQ